MQKITLKVIGMSCGGCKRAVTQALSSLAGVDSVDIDLTTGETTIEYDAAKVTLQDMTTAILDAGFEVSA